MVEVKEFAGLRPLNPEKFCTKPYDVIGKEEMEDLRKNLDSAIHIILPVEDGDKYENARREFERLKKNMVRDEPSIYLYKEGNEDFSQRGFILCVSLKDYENGWIKKHEETREKPLQDRIKHIEAVKAHTGLVWTFFNKNDNVKKIMEEILKEKPVFDFKKYNYRHQLWKISDKKMIERIKEVFHPMHLYIADGHHRIAASYEYWKKYDGEEAKYVMIFSASDDEIKILPYNRVIKKIDVENFIERLKKDFYVEKMREIKEPKKHEIQIYYKKEWWKISPKNLEGNVVERLDVSIVQNKILEPILGIKDVRRNPNIFFVGGEMERKEYEEFVDKKGNDAVIYLHPTSIEELKEVADAKLNMPPKSTWFHPKLLTGLVFHTINE
ncbi:MAG TPA: DUF1015 domain-containing protein [Thermoplasmatales archaeon]|nr:DUF1015 domain-containing protein [Thermoplasmatales archaeon]